MYVHVYIAMQERSGPQSIFIFNFNKGNHPFAFYLHIPSNQVRLLLKKISLNTLLDSTLRYFTVHFCLS